MRQRVNEIFEGEVNAPEFPEGLEWLNTDQPIRLRDLRGKIVLLDFWTYGCINCIHIMPDLDRLQAEYPDELVIIGVHSAKFKNEGETANIREIVQRYGITHPVVNDYDFDIWNAYGAQAWPTLALIDPAGKIVGEYAGEGVYQVFAPVLSAMVRQWDARKGIDRKPIRITPEMANRKPAPLSFPGKVLADPAGRRLFIADSNHNRVVVADLKTYEVRAIYGSGAAGFKDGAATTAQFYRPQGLALQGGALYVADTENHAIRAVDLSSGTVTTLAGTGAQALKRNKGGPGLDTELNSPWDLTALGDMLYIAMAGNHQLWTLNLKDPAHPVAPFVGSGREGLTDGPFADAELAQPSGIITDGKPGGRLYFTDPEASAIRIADLGPAARVDTIIGKGLFDFGDKDGPRADALLQHALGITLAPDGKLYIADTYNHCIKQVDPAAGTVTTLYGQGKTGMTDGGPNEALFNEPGGVSYADGKLYVADTNNDAIRVIDLSAKTVTTVNFPNADVLAIAPDAARGGDAVTLPAQTVAPGARTITVNVTVPSAYKFNDTAPFALSIDPDPLLTFPDGRTTLEVLKPTMPLTWPVTLREGSTTLAIDADVYYCDAVNERLCYVSRVSFTLPLTVANGGAQTLTIAYQVTPPKVPNSTFKGGS